MKNKTKRELITISIVIPWVLVLVAAFVSYINITETSRLRGQLVDSKDQIEDLEDKADWLKVAERIERKYDLKWLKEQDDLDLYQNFASRIPTREQETWLKKRIIDLEVDKIAKGEHGDLPQAQATSYGGSTTKITIKNGTGYLLTVLYSGPSSKRVVLAVGATEKIGLSPGSYKVAASVSAAHVRNYYGQSSMRGGEYSSSFYTNTLYRR